MIKNIIFDWSGTLSDNTDYAVQVIDHLFKRLGRKEGISKEEVRNNFSLPYMTFYNKYFPNLTKEEQNGLYKEEISKTPVPDVFPGVKETIGYLDYRKIKMCILSTDNYTTLNPEVKKSGLEECFIEVKGEVYDKGPVLVDMIKEHNFDPRFTLYVGDTDGDVNFGKYAKVQTAGMTWGLQNEHLIEESNPDYIFNNLIELQTLINLR